jgi:hypothetical protein
MDAFDNRRKEFIRYECPLSTLVRIASSADLGDPRREIAREALKGSL